MLLTLFLILMVFLFAWLARLQGFSRPLMLVFNVMIGAACGAWIWYRIATGQHPVTSPSLFSDVNFEHLIRFSPELYALIGISVIITAVLVGAVFDMANRPN